MLGLPGAPQFVKAFAAAQSVREVVRLVEVRHWRDSLSVHRVHQMSLPACNPIQLGAEFGMDRLGSPCELEVCDHLQIDA